MLALHNIQKTTPSSIKEGEGKLKKKKNTEIQGFRMLHQDYECRNVGEYYTVNTCMVDVRSSYAAVTQPVATNSNHKFHYIIYTILSRG